MLTGIPVVDDSSAKKAGEKLLSRGINSVLITLGAKGVYIVSEGISQLVPGFKVDAVDTTAAGDVFNGALAVSLGEKKEWIDAIRFANAAAALSVTKLGAQPSAPQRDEIEKLMN